MAKRSILWNLKNNADFISSQDLIKNANEILKAKENYHFVTFDDGLKEQYQLAVPILDDLQIPAVLFANSRNFKDKKVTTVHKIHLLRSIISPSDFLQKISQFEMLEFSEEYKKTAKSIYVYDSEDDAVLKYILNFKMDYTIQEAIIKTIFDVYFNEKEVLESLYMSENELVNLSKKGFLGSHTHNHYPIGLLNEEAIEYELLTSKLFFEKLTNTKIDMVAYPYGNPEASTNKVAEIANQLGYKFGFTTSRGINTSEKNLLLLNRFDCNDLVGGKNYSQI